MKKHLLLLLASGILLMNPVCAKDVIVPYQLTEKDSGGYSYVNTASARMFENLITKIRIDTNRISDTYNRKLIKNKQTKLRNPNYNYVTYRYAELMYNKKTGDLTDICVEKIKNPKSDAIYDYPTGRLKYIQVFDGATNRFVKYMPYGSLYNVQAYMSNIGLTLTRRLNKNLSAKPESTVKINIKIENDGTLLSAKLLQSTGDEMLDAEILEIVQKSAPFDKFEHYFPQTLDMTLQYGAKK